MNETLKPTQQRTAFPEHLTELRDGMPQLLTILEQGKEDSWYAFVWLEEMSTKTVNCARTQSIQENMDRGIVFRIFANGKNYEMSTNQLELDHLKSLAQDFRSKVEKGITSGSSSKTFRPLSWEEEQKIPLGEEFTEQIPPNTTAENWIHLGIRCQKSPQKTTPESLQKAAVSYREQILKVSSDYVDSENEKFSPEESHQHLADVRVMFRQTLRTHIFVDRCKRMTQTLPITLLYAMGISASGITGRSIAGGMGGEEIGSLNEAEIRQAAVMPLTLSKAPRIQPGRYQLITGPDVTGVIAHEAFGHTQEGDTWMKGRSIAENLHKNKDKVGNSEASIVNFGGVFSMDKLAHGTNGSYFFDHEGQLSRPQAILDQGFLSTPMTDLMSAVKMDVPRTSNGKRESWRRPLMTRQTNTYFTPGKHSFDALVGMVKDGFLARFAHGGMEDPKGGSLTAGTEYLEEIKEGKLTGQIFLGPNGGHVELSDPVFTLLDRIIAKSESGHQEDIPENKYGGCGKYHKEVVDAGCGGPYILWESLNCG